MARDYYTLAVREDDRWAAQFGDYDCYTVECERRDYRDHGHKAWDLKILVTPAGGRQAAIDAAIAELNAAIAKLNAKGA